jgi:hypothetical protein
MKNGPPTGSPVGDRKTREQYDFRPHLEILR